HVLSSRSAILFTARVPLDLFTLSLHDALPILITGLLNSVLGGDLLGGLLTGDGLVDIPLLEQLLGETGLLGGLLDGLLGDKGLVGGLLGGLPVRDQGGGAEAADVAAETCCLCVVALVVGCVVR